MLRDLDSSAENEGIPEDLCHESKVQLILIGERLFAEQGVEGTSLREIAAAAGHGNNNAVRYHFGSKDGLIQAIFRYRVAWLDKSRRHLLSVIEQKGLSTDVRALLEVIYLPYLTMRDRDGRLSYPAFLHQYLIRHRPRGMTHAGDDARALSPSLHKVFELLRARLFYLDPQTFDRRVLIASSTFLSMLLNNENLDPRPEGDALKTMIDDTLAQLALSMAFAPNRSADFIDSSFLR